MGNAYIDLDEMLRRMRGNKKMVAMMLEMFLEGEELKQLENDLDKKDYAAAEISSHGIKGMVGNLSMTMLFEVTEQLNNELKAGPPNGDTVEKYYEILDRTTDTARNVLSTL